MQVGSFSDVKAYHAEYDTHLTAPSQSEGLCKVVLR